MIGSKLGLRKKRQKPLIGKTITVITLPRSGSAFIRAVICSKMRLEPVAAGTGPRMGVLIEPSKLYKRATLMPAYVHGHYAPVDFNIQCLSLLGLTDLVVHMRDPRDALVSWYHQIERPAVKEDVPTQVLLQASGDVIDGYYDRSREEKYDHLIENLMPKLIAWISGWMKIAAEDPRLRIHLTHYKLLRDPIQYFNDIAQFYDLNRTYELKDFPEFTPGSFKYNFRKGESGTYRSELNSKQIRRVDDMIGEISDYQFIEREQPGPSQVSSPTRSRKSHHRQ